MPGAFHVGDAEGVVEILHDVGLCLAQPPQRRLLARRCDRGYCHVCQSVSPNFEAETAPVSAGKVGHMVCEVIICLSATLAVDTLFRCHQKNKRKRSGRVWRYISEWI